MATASAWAGREPEPLRHHGPGPRQPRDPRPSQQLGSVEKTGTPPRPHNTPSHCQCRHSRVSESLARETGRLQRALSPEPDLITVQALLCFLTGHSKALRSPSPPHLSSTKLCPRNGNPLKGEERAIQSDKLLSNWYSVLLLRLLLQTPPPPPPSPTATFASAAFLVSRPIKPGTCLARGSRRKGWGALTSGYKHEMFNHNFHTQAAV